VNSLKPFTLQRVQQLIDKGLLPTTGTYDFEGMAEGDFYNIPASTVIGASRASDLENYK
jgi:hypothetical protein